MSSAGLKVEITEGDLKNAVAIAIAESFTGEQRDALLRDVVRAHLSLKLNTYDKETLLSKHVGNMIRRVAENEVSAIFSEQMEPRIREIVREKLGPKYCDNIVDEVKGAVESFTIRGLRFTATVREIDD